MLRNSQMKSLIVFCISLVSISQSGTPPLQEKRMWTLAIHYIGANFSATINDVAHTRSLTYTFKSKEAGFSTSL